MDRDAVENKKTFTNKPPRLYYMFSAGSNYNEIPLQKVTNKTFIVQGVIWEDAPVELKEE